MRHLPKLLALPLTLAACVQSVYPLYTDETLVAEPALVGTWTNAENEVLVVSPLDSLTYRLVLVATDDDPTVWVGRVTALAGRRWLDVEPEALPDQWTEEYRNAFLPLHQFWALQRVDTILQPASLQLDSLKALLEREPAALAHAWIDGDLVLTAETPALRAFLAAIAERPGYLGPADPMWRAPTRR